MTRDRGPSTRSCPACQGDVMADARFCTHCGATLDGDQASLTAASSPAAASPPAPGSRPAHRQATEETTVIDTGTPDEAVAANANSTTVMKAVSKLDGTAAGDAGRNCPSCGGPNSVHRELCGRCGADLETGIVPPRPEPTPLPAVTPGAVRSAPHRRRWWIPIVAIVGVVGAIVATFWIAELGPFASEPTVPEATFAAAAYDEEHDTVVLSDIATATTRPPDGTRTFTAAQMVDADPTTAWHSDTASLPEGLGEKIDLFLDEPAWIDQLVINNGDHSDSDAYAATSRILRARLVLDGGRAFEINLLDQGRQPQYIELPTPELTTTVRIEVLESIPGDDREDIAVSDVELRGWAATPADAELAERRAEVRRAAGPVVLQD